MSKRPEQGIPASESSLTRTKFLGLSAAAIGTAGGLGALLDESAGAFAETRHGPDGYAAANATLDWATEEPARNFDPAFSANIGSLTGIEHIFEALTRINAQGGADPLLITGPPKRIGARQVSVELREGLVFHDGSPLTAADVVFSYKRHMNPKTASIFGPGLAVIKSIQAMGSRRVLFTLDRYTSYFPLTLALIKIFSAKGVRSKGEANYFLKPAGSGVFAVTDLRPQVSYRLQRFDRYGGPQPKPLLAGVTSHAALSGPSRVAQLRSGAFEVIDHVPIADVDTLKRISGIVVSPTHGSAQVNMEFEHSKPPFNDVRVRRAFMYALDRNAISRLVFRGDARLAHSMLATNSPYFVEPRTKYPHNPARAKALLTAAGHRDGVDFELLVKSDNIFLPAVAQVMQQQLQEVGLRAKLKETTGGYDLAVQGKYQAFLSYYNIGLFTDPVDFYYRFALYGANGKAYYRWTDASARRFAAFVDAAYYAQSFKERKARYAQAQELVNQVVPGAFPLLYVPVISAWQKKVRGFRTPGNDLSDFRRVSIS